MKKGLIVVMGLILIIMSGCTPGGPTGSFNSYCNVPCGYGHSSMIGRIIVE